MDIKVSVRLEISEQVQELVERYLRLRESTALVDFYQQAKNILKTTVKPEASKENPNPEEQPEPEADAKPEAPVVPEADAEPEKPKRTRRARKQEEQPKPEEPVAPEAPAEPTEPQPIDDLPFPAEPSRISSPVVERREMGLPEWKEILAGTRSRLLLDDGQENFAKKRDFNNLVREMAKFYGAERPADLTPANLFWCAEQVNRIEFVDGEFTHPASAITPELVEEYKQPPFKK